MEKQRIWQEPKLIVLARSTPEESVLATCKSAAGSGATGTHHNNCGAAAGCPTYCSTQS